MGVCLIDMMVVVGAAGAMEVKLVVAVLAVLAVLAFLVLLVLLEMAVKAAVGAGVVRYCNGGVVEDNIVVVVVLPSSSVLCGLRQPPPFLRPDISFLAPLVAVVVVATLESMSAVTVAGLVRREEREVIRGNLGGGHK